MKKKIVSIALCVILVFLTLPLSAIAEEATIAEADVPVKENQDVPEASVQQEKTPVLPETEGELPDQTVTENGTVIETKIADEQAVPSATALPKTTAQPSPSPTTSEVEFYYSERYDGTLTITGISAVPEKIEVPAEINGKKVSEVRELVYSNSDVKEIIVPEGITNISSLANYCPNLTKLSLPSTLSGYFSISGVGLKNADGFKKATNLINLNISNTPLEDISGLKALSNLSNFSISNVPLQNISVLSSLDNLKTIKINNTQIQNVAALKNLQKLETVDLNYNTELKDISELKNLENLKYLYLSECSNVTAESKAGLLRMEDMQLYTTDVYKTISMQPTIFDENGTGSIVSDPKFVIESEDSSIAKITKESNWEIRGLKTGKTKAVIKYDGRTTGNSFSVQVAGLSAEPDQPVGEKIENLPSLDVVSVPGGTETLALYDNGQLWKVSGEQPELIKENVKKYVGMSTYVGVSTYAQRSGLSWTMIEDNEGTLWTREIKAKEAPVLNKRVDNVVKYVGVAAYGSSGIVNGYAMDKNFDFWNLGGNNTNIKAESNVKDFDALGFNQSGVGVAVLKQNGDLLVRVDPSTGNFSDNKFVKLESGVSSLEQDEHFIKEGALYGYSLDYSNKKVVTIKLGDSVKAYYENNLFAVKTDGTTWCQRDRQSPTYKILDTELKQYVFTNTKGKNYYYLLDNNNTLWRWEQTYSAEEVTAEKIATNVSYMDKYCYITENKELYDFNQVKLDSNVKKVIPLDSSSDVCVLKEDNVVYRNGVALLTNVGDMVEDSIEYYNVSGVYLTRLDGTTWYMNKAGDPTPNEIAGNMAKVDVTGVKITPSEVAVTEGYSAELKAVIEPANATNQRVSWKSSNPEVVTVDNGAITGVKDGTAKITVTTADGNKTAECKVTVKKAIPMLKPESGTAEGVISGQTGQDFINDLKANNIIGRQDQVQVLTADGKEADINKPLATGMKIVVTTGAKLFNRAAAGTQEYTVVVMGDSTGDGNVNILDMLSLQDDILGKEKLEGCYRTAGDINKDNSINIMDMLAIQDDILGKEKINPYE